MKKKNVIFITGTDTSVGKTVVSAALVNGLLLSGEEVSYWKPVQAGIAEEDSNFIANNVGSTCKIIKPLFRFEKPASPDQSATAEGASQATVAAMISTFENLEFEGSLLIEGAGGLLVPLNDRGETWLEFIQKINCQVVVVARTGLGTLNHSAMTLRLLQMGGIKPTAIIMNGQKHNENCRSLATLMPDVPQINFERLLEFAPDAQWNSQSKAFAEQYQQLSPPLQRSEEELQKKDKDCCWHPYTQHGLNSVPLMIEKAHGSHLFLKDGTKLIDGTSSWWVNTIGHGRPEIATAISAQQQILDHVIFAGATHEQPIVLASQILEFAGGHLDRVFYSDNGSTAVEIGLKMAYQNWVNKGETGRTKFLALEGSYHGDTIGTMSVAAAGHFHKTFEPLMFESFAVKPVTVHKSNLCPNGTADEAEYLQQLRDLLEKHHHKMAGVLLEPLIQGAGGMLVQSQSWLKQFVEICRSYQLPIIFDEVFSGMGRIGANFAFMRADVQPDIVCLAKGLTGGNLPLALTLSTESIFETFSSERKQEALLHGHSYTANAISCAAALATLSIYRKDRLIEKALKLESVFSAWTEQMAQAELLENPRCIGGVMAFELAGSGPKDYFHMNADLVTKKSIEKGLFIRPLGNTLYFVPPLTIAEDEVNQALVSMEQVVRELV